MYFFCCIIFPVYSQQKNVRSKTNTNKNLPDASITKMNPSSYGKYSNHNEK